MERPQFVTPKQILDRINKIYRIEKLGPSFGLTGWTGVTG
jgi:hypothetical protein